jgi:REP element-mobilizing transposase RayT
MPRGPRSNLAEYRFFHAYARGVDRMAISRDDADRTAWVALLARTVRRFALTFHAYCLMPNHFHLVVESELDDLSRGMHHLNGLYAQRFNRRHERSGHLFQGRFGIRVIESEEYLHGACAYVVENPVRAGLCELPADWPWSAGPSLPGTYFPDTSEGLSLGRVR